MERPKIAGWEVTVNENNVQMATLNSERLIETLKYIEYLESKVENLNIQRVSDSALPDTPDDEIYDFACDLHNADKILNAALLIKRHTTMNLEQAKQYCYSHYR